VRRDCISWLCCPACAGNLELADADSGNDPVTAGSLACLGCGITYPIVRSIPRFVPSDNYATGFGLQWNRHSLTQLDSHTGLSLSAERFFEQSRWPAELSGETIIEAGCGAGRFTGVAADTGARVLSLDYSEAVEANYASNGWRDNVLIVQGDIYNMPFGQADRVFCFGVIQHTPDPQASFAAITRHVKAGGSMSADVYVKSFARYVLGTKYWVRPITRRMPPETLYRWTKRYVDAMWPIARVVRRIPKVGRNINWRLLIADSSHRLSDDAVLRDWAHLDTFDMLAPRYDYPQTLRTVRRWGAEAGLVDFEVERCAQGIAMRGRKPLAAASADSGI
jgi:SAM-dependent methyltransferase